MHGGWAAGGYAAASCAPSAANRARPVALGGKAPPTARQIAARARAAARAASRPLVPFWRLGAAASLRRARALRLPRDAPALAAAWQGLLDIHAGPALAGERPGGGAARREESGVAAAPTLLPQANPERARNLPAPRQEMCAPLRAECSLDHLGCSLGHLGCLGDGGSVYHSAQGCGDSTDALQNS